MSSKEYTYRWNPQKDFLEKYRALMDRVKQGDHSAYYQVKELRTKEFRNTVDIVNQGGYVTENGKCYSFRRRGNFPWIASAPLTKYLSTTFRI